MQAKQSRHVNYMLRAAAVLLCMVLVSLYLVCGLYAKYTASATGSDSARVAKFDVTNTLKQGGQTVTSITAEVAPNETSVTAIEVKNSSEIAIQYTIEIHNQTKNLPLKFNVENTDYVALDNGDHQFSAEMAPGTVKTYSLEISWPVEAEKLPLALDSMGMVDLISVTLTAEQID